MKTLLIAFALPTALAAQQSTGFAFQNAIVTPDGPGTLRVMTRAQIGRAVVGRPISATEEHRSLQVLGDGTRIESKTASTYYRDEQGRTRTDNEDGTTLIDDPVAGAHAEFQKRRATTAAPNFVSTRTQKFYFSTAPASGDAVQMAKRAAEADANTDKQKAEAMIRARTTREEDLGYQVVNGISAHGTRTTTTIPIGQIGNDRPINIVSEQWYSPDLQLLVKSVNNDPRYGENTYDLTDIVQAAQDPALFKIPAENHRQ